MKSGRPGRVGPGRPGRARPGRAGRAGAPSTTPSVFGDPLLVSGSFQAWSPLLVSSAERVQGKIHPHCLQRHFSNKSKPFLLSLMTTRPPKTQQLTTIPDANTMPIKPAAPAEASSRFVGIVVGMTNKPAVDDVRVIFTEAFMVVSAFVLTLLVTGLPLLLGLVVLPRMPLAIPFAALESVEA